MAFKMYLPPKKKESIQELQSIIFFPPLLALNLSGRLIHPTISFPVCTHPLDTYKQITITLGVIMDQMLFSPSPASHGLILKTLAVSLSFTSWWYFWHHFLSGLPFSCQNSPDLGIVTFQLFLPSAVNIHSEGKFLSLGGGAPSHLLCLPMRMKVRKGIKEKEEEEEEEKVATMKPSVSCI